MSISTPSSCRRVLGGLAFCAALGSAAPIAWAQKTGAILPGGNSNKPISIEATKLDYFDKEQKLVYTGNVVATQGDAKLKATVLTILLAPKGAGSSAGPAAGSTNQVQHMYATGPVTVLQRDQIGTGNSGVYDKATNTVVLTGDVTLSQGPNVTKGEKLTYDLKSGQAVVTGRVKSMFLPGSDTSIEAKSDEPTPVAGTSRRGARVRGGAGTR